MPDFQQDPLPPIPDPANIDEVRAEQPAPRTLDNVADTIAEDFPEQEIQPNLLAPQPVSPEQSLQRKAADAMTAMQNVVLYGQSSDSKKWLDEHPEYKDFLDPDLIKNGGGHYLIGAELAAQCNGGDVFGILYNILDNEKDEARKQELATQIKACNTADANQLLGKLFSEGVQDAYDERKEYVRFLTLKQQADDMTADLDQRSLIAKVVDSGLHKISREDAETLQKAGLLNAAMAANAAYLAYLNGPSTPGDAIDDPSTAGEIGDIISSSENPALTRQLFAMALQQFEDTRAKSEGRDSIVGHALGVFAKDAAYSTQGYLPDKYLAAAQGEARSINSSYFDDRADVLSLIRNTRAAAQQGLKQESSSWYDTLYNIGIAAGDMAPYFVPGFMSLALARHNIEAQQDNISTLMDDGVLTDAERVEAGINANTSTLANAAAMFGTIKAFKYAGTKFLPAPIARVSQYRLGAFAVNTAEQTANFGVALPAAEGVLNWALEAATVQDERVRKGKQELAELISNMGDGEYWLTNIGLASIGALMHNTGSVQAARQRLEDRTFGRIAGLTEEQLDSTETLPPAERAAKRYEFMQENRKNDAPASILRSIEAIKASAEKYQAAQSRRDNATTAALQQQGFHVEPAAEPGKVNLYYDGKVDAKGNFNKGENKITLTPEDANAYLNGVVADNAKGFINQLRTAAANGRIMDAIKTLQGKVTLETLRSPEIVSRVQEKAKAAEQRKRERAQKLMDEAAEKGETLDRAKAEAKAGRETHDDIAKGETLDDIISFGEQMKQRMEIDKARGVDTENTASRAYVVSRTNLDTNAVERVFKIATNATTREVVEEYGEQLRKDWMDAQDISALQAYRMLADLQANFGDKANFLTLSKRNATLHEKATDTRFDEGSFTDSERTTIDREVTEALSKLLMSDLLQQVQTGRTAIPAWARTLFDGSNLVETEMQNEMALGSALAQARQEGWMPDLMKNLLGVAPDAVAKALEAKAAPQPQEYRNAYMDALHRQFELDARYGAGRTTDPELIEQEYNTAVEGQRAADEQAAAQEAEAAQPAAEIVKEVEQEQGLSHEEAVKATADSYNAEQETRTAENPAAIQDSAFSNGACTEITDSTGLLCKSGTVNVANLKILPNFKRNADSETGVVQGKELTGDYRPDHDPIRVFRAQDGTLWVISGRHRLAKCKAAGVDKISAYVYDESPALDMQWAHRFDIESNIRDNQASVIECALYTRGELFEGGHPLSDAEAVQAGLTRKDTQGNIGFKIGRNAAGPIIDALRNGQLDPGEAFRIAMLAPRNLRVQNVGLILREQGESWKTVEDSMHDTLDEQAKEGDNGQMDMFGVLDSAEDVMRRGFENKYKNRRIKAINDELSYLNQVAGGGSVKRNAKYDVNVKSPEKLKERIDALKTLRHQWENMRFYPELVQEARRAYAGEELFAEQTNEDIARREQEANGEQPRPAAQDNPGQSTFNFSTTAGLKESENPVDDLGRVGSRFAGPLNRNFQPTGFEAVDERLQRMLNSARSEAIRMTTVGSEKSGSAGVKLYMEAVGIINSVTPLLPQQYRFSLEPYKTFFNVYSVLHETGKPQDAADAVPMDGWDERMLSSFVKSFKRLYKDRDLMRDGFWKDVPNAEDIIAKLEALPKRTSMKKAMQTEAGRELFKAMGNMRAQQLMQHYLERVQKQLDSFRKDSIRGRILRAVASLKPATKQGKPAKGRIAPDALRTVNTRMRLLQLTRGQQQDVMEQYAKEDANGISEWNKLPDTAEIKVRTFNEEGEEITLTTTKQDFELYSCFDAMDAAEADAAARALGSFIQDGKDYWEIMNDRARQRIAEVCDPMIDAASPHYQNNVRSESRKRNRLIRKAGQNIRAATAWLMNDVQFMHALAKEGNIGQMFARFERDMAHAHVLLEQGEMDTHAEINRIYTEVTGSNKKKDWTAFTDDVNAFRQSGIRLKPQSPDFERREAETLRAQLLTRLNFVTERKQNFDPDVVAKAISNLNARADLIPAEVLEEVNAKYGSIGSVEAYEAKYQKAKGTQKQALEEAVENVFGTSRFEHLKNFNQAVKDRAAKARAKWQETHSLLGESEPLELTKNIAAYRVLIWEQEQYRDSMRQQGYTEEVIQQLRDFAGEQMMNFAYKLRDSLNARTDDVAAVYEQIYGMPFPKVENYFRAFFHTGKGDDASNALEADAGNAANAGSLSILKHRVQHNAPIEPLMSVTQAYSNGRKQQDTLLAYSTADYYLPQELTALLHYRKRGVANAPTMRDVLDDFIGSQDVSILEEHVKAMTRLSAEADNITRDVGRWFSLLSNTSAVNILNWRVGSLVKQLTAAFNSVSSDSVTLTQWMAAQLRARFGRAKLSHADMAKRMPLAVRNKGFRYSGNIATFNANEGVVSSAGATSSKLNSGMYAMEWLDFQANVSSSRVLYDAVYRKLQKQNPAWTPEILDAAAMEAVEISLANKAQPLDFRSRAAVNLRRDFWRTTSFFLGGETVNTIGRVFSLASRGQFGKAAALWLAQGAALQALTFVWNFLTDDKEQWQKRSLAGYMAGAVFGPLSGVPFFGDIVGGGVSYLKKETGATWLPYMNQSEILPYINLGRLWNDWNKALEKGDTIDIAICAESTLRDLATATAMASHNPGSKTTAAIKGISIGTAAAANIVDFLLRTTRAQSEEGLLTRAQQAPETLLTTTPKKKSTRRRAPSDRRAPSRRTAP